MEHTGQQRERRRELREEREAPPLEHLTRLAQHDAAMRERVTPQVEALVAALSAPSSLFPFASRKRA